MAALAALATVAALLLNPSQTAHAAPPPNPTDTQLNSAAAAKANLATEVGNLSAQVASLQTQLQQMSDQAELAEQKYAYAEQKLQEAQAAADQARRNAASAQQGVAAAQQEFVSFAQAAYMDGQVGGTTGTLLSAGDPNVLLQQGALEQYQSSHQIGAISALQRATVAKSNADAAARKAVDAQTAATKAASDAKATAIALLAQTKVQAQQVQQTLDASQARLDTARATLMTLTGQRAQYVAYQKEQARLAAIARAEALRRQQEAEAAARQRALAYQRQQQQQQQQQQPPSTDSNGGQSYGGGGGGSSSGGGGGSSSSPSGGGWTAARGQDAANRASRWVGMPYCWDGGDASGPTYGAGGPGCGVGFDCSGLTLNAWAPYIALDHYTVTQYYNAGSVHPTPGNFLPGDLLFWGTTSNIHHVAIYVGNGDVIQAPDFGIPVEVTPWDQVESDYFGATRPMT